MKKQGDAECFQIMSISDLKVEVTQRTKMPTFVSDQGQRERGHYLRQILVLYLVNVIRV